MMTRRGFFVSTVGLFVIPRTTIPVLRYHIPTRTIIARMEVKTAHNKGMEYKGIWNQRIQPGFPPEKILEIDEEGMVHDCGMNLALYGNDFHCVRREDDGL